MIIESKFKVNKDVYQLTTIVDTLQSTHRESITLNNFEVKQFEEENAEYSLHSENESNLNFDNVLIDLKTDLSKIEVIYEGEETSSSCDL